jgi:4-hydroxybutyrate dehydrogenase / sulfolactaldehyde 3-reductase
MTERIGFIGLGNMGGPMAANLVRKGFRLTVLDKRPAQVEKLASLGAAPAAGVAEVVLASDIVVTMVPDTPDVEGIVLGPDGTLARGRAGLLHMDMSTIAPAASRRMAEALAAKGMRWVDAGVGRSPAHAERGESLFMVGADAADLARVTPLLEAMGDKIIHAGPPGSGIALKIVNNYIAMCLCQLNAEAFAMAAKLGIPAKTLFDVVTSSLASNDHLKLYWPTKALKGDIEPGFALDLAFKDLSIGVGAAADAGAPAHVGKAAREAMERARKAHGLGAKDVTALLMAAAAEAGIKPPRL